MDRRVFLCGLTLGTLSAPRAATAQTTTKAHRIGWLSAESLVPHGRVEGFRQALRALGYIESRNVVIEARYADGKAERLPDLAAELVRLRVDVIVAMGAPAIRAAQRATPTIPIVMAGTADAVAQGFVTSLARPGGNITGVSDLGAELHEKRLELLKEAVPQSVRIAALLNPASPYHTSRLQTLTAGAKRLGVQLQVVEVRSPEQLNTAFAALQSRADALLIVDDALVLSPSRVELLAKLAAASRLPAMYSWREYVNAGGFLSYGPSFRHTDDRAAAYVDKILKGAKPDDLPVEQPTKFELVINLKTARALGLTIPPSVLGRADQVIE